MSQSKKRSPSRRNFRKNSAHPSSRSSSPAATSPSEPFHATVRDLSSDGRGVAIHPAGFTVFIEGAWIGEEGNFQITEKKNKWATGKIIELTKYSPSRIKPFCSHQGPNLCGGCPWQFIDYQEQLRAKQRRVTAAIENILKEKFKKERILPIQPSPTIKSFRNRAQLKTDGNQIGFHSFNSNKLIPIANCEILSKHNQATLKALINSLPNSKWRPAKNSQHITLHLDETLDIESVSIDKRLPFQQSHAQQNKFMQDWLRKKLNGLEKTGERTAILELFCGSGNFTDILAERENTDIVAVDCIDEATQSLASKNYKNVSILNVDLYSENAFNKIYSKQKYYSLLLLDPPRSGLKNAAGLFPENLKSKKSKFKDIFYISCDVASFCRDIKLFSENGFKLLQVQPVDIAPHSPHVELLAHFSLR